MCKDHRDEINLIDSPNPEQNMYDNLIQSIYRDILQKEKFTGKRGTFERTENGMVRSVKFASWHDKNNTITFRIGVEVRFENEAQLRREDKIAGMGCYREYFPQMPKWNEQDGRWLFGEKDYSITKCFKIQKQTDIGAIKDTIKMLLDEALHKAMQFQTQEDLAVFVNAEHKKSADRFLRQKWAQTRRFYLGFGVLSCLCIIAGRQLLMPMLMILLAMYCLAVMIVDIRSQRWLRRMIFIPIAELLVLVFLLSLISTKVIGNGVVIKGLCIGLFGSGLISLIIQVNIMFLKAYNKRQERKIRWLR